MLFIRRILLLFEDWMSFMNKNARSLFFNNLSKKIIDYCFFALSILIVLSKLLYLMDFLPKYASILLFVFIVGLIIFIKMHFFRILSYLKKIHLKIRTISPSFIGYSYNKYLLIILISNLVLKIACVYCFQINSIDNHPDIHTYVVTSSELIELGYAKSYALYCYSFSHMFWFAVFLMPITKLFGMSYLAYSLYMTLVTTLSIILLFDTLADRFSTNRAFLICIIYSFLPSSILLPQFITHEMASLFFLIFAIWLYFKEYNNTKTRIAKSLILLCVFFLLLFCSLLNAMGLVAVIAFIIVFCLETTHKKNFFFKIVKILLLVVFIVFGTHLFGIIQLNHSLLPDEFIKENKILWTLYVGSNYSSGGGWYEDDKWNSLPTNYRFADINSYRLNLVLTRYGELLSDPWKIISLLRIKLVKIWGDFFYPIGYANDLISNDTISLFYNKVLFKPLTIINYVILFAASISGLFSSNFRIRKNINDSFLIFCELFLLGETIMLMITECNNKYTIGIIPFFIATAFSTNFYNTYYEQGNQSG